MINLLKQHILLSISFVLFALFLAQNAMGLQEGGINKLVLLLYLLVGCWSLFKILLQKKRNSIINRMLLFIFLMFLTWLLSPKIVYGKINEAIGLMRTVDILRNICIYCMSLFIGYYCASKKAVEEKYIVLLAAIFVICAIGEYYTNMLLLSHKKGGATNNSGYLFVNILPYIPIVYRCNKRLSYIILLISIALIIGSAKRGAILCLFVCFFIIGWYYIKYNKISATKIILFAFVSILILCICYWFYLQNDYLIARMSNSQKETRDIAYYMLLDYWLQNDLYHQIFGNGMSYSVVIWGNYAHNDWLELLSSNGIIGVLLYFYIFIAMFKILRYKNLDYIDKISVSLIIVTSLCRSLYSMNYTALTTGEVTLLLGIILGNAKFNKNIICQKLHL